MLRRTISGLSPLKPLCRKLSPPKTTQHTTHVVEGKSSDVEKGLNELLDKVKEVYGGEGKVKAPTTPSLEGHCDAHA